MSETTSDILNRLAEEARRLRMVRIPQDGELAWDQIQQVQTALRNHKGASGASLKTLSRQLGPGFSASLLSQFLGAESREQYPGDIDRITRTLHAFLESAARREDAPKPKGWIETRVARKMLTLISRTIELGAMGLIYSDAGRGKTMTFEAALSIHPGSLLIRVTSTSRKPAGLARQIAAALRLGVNRNTYTIQQQIIEELKGSRRCIFLDEAHQLDKSALEFIRDIHDAAGVPIVLAGTMKLSESTADHDAFFGQFTRRIALRYDVTEEVRGSLHRPGSGPGPGTRGASRPLHSVEEIKAMFASDKIRLTDDGLLCLTKLANILGLGGLGTARWAVMVAALAVKPGESIDARLLLRVMRSMHGVTYATSVIEKAIDQQQIEAATA